MNKINCDLIIVGAGPAGIFTALELIRREKKKHIVIVEKGLPIEKRRCPKSQTQKCISCKPHCHITTGFSGAGAFSDGKLSLSCEVGGDLPQLIGEDIVQNIFLKLWNDRKTLEIENSLKSYLLKAVRNYCLDELRHRRIIDEHVAYELKSGSIDIDTTENYILYSDLCRQLKNALEQLPPQEREVFEMSRLENIKYQEIANRLNISVRTVEVRISKALKQLRILLKDFYLLLFFFLFH